ncbi:hypothetical protein AB4Z52_17860 [Rhizobium sp. 2YAF20]|uniref:hypothetical protein n=1 Tax=Rhizobium sp. 2YAF20 TaxID=3233027 RepID=UPI003F9B2070
MEFPLLNLMKEIRNEIGPLLRELGLRPKLTSLSWGVNVEFKASDGSYSPVELQVGHETMAGAGWKYSSIRTANYNRIDVGYNGWLFHEYCGGCNARSLPDDRKARWTQIESTIENLRVIQVGDEKPGYTKDVKFVAMVKAAENALGEGYRYDCQRDNGISSFKFRDSHDREWRVAFQGGKARIYVDGTYDRSFALRASEAVGNYLSFRVLEPASDVASELEI